MKTIILSNHPKEQAKRMADARDATYIKKKMEYDKAIEEHNKNVKEKKDNLIVPRKINEVIPALKYLGKYIVAVLTLTPWQPYKEEPTTSEIIYNQGAEGEIKVVNYLNQLLNDEWTILTGYRNKKGEIDQILIGPQGIFTIECKYMNGHIYCDGDIWWRDKYDKYGNKVESNLPIKDKRGRGPSTQLNEPSDYLLSKLVEVNSNVKIYRIIIFSADSSKIGEINNLKVDAVTVLKDLNNEFLFNLSSEKYSAKDIIHIIHAIQKDHFAYNR